MYCRLVCSLAFVLLAVGLVEAHGMVHDPVCRQTRWRVNSTAPVNYNDNQLFCGGFGVSAKRDNTY